MLSSWEDDQQVRGLSHASTSTWEKEQFITTTAPLGLAMIQSPNRASQICLNTGLTGGA